MRKIYITALMLITIISCSGIKEMEYPELIDNNLETSITGNTEVNQFIFSFSEKSPALGYSIVSSGQLPQHDPYSWTLKGSTNGRKWTIVDQREMQSFCSRYQEKGMTIQNPGNYKQYMLEVSTQNQNTLTMSEFRLFDQDRLHDWKSFKYPEVNFETLAPNALGNKFYALLVQNPRKYIRYHAMKVAGILFYTGKDTMNNVQQINYTLKDYEGISAKSGQPPIVSIVYSTQHVEKSFNESLFQLNMETRGVLYHELTHAYQFEPKGIGSYSTNKEFWACIEGLADAVRTQAGFFDVEASRKPGGHWLDGYRTTGFFLHWLTTKDPDAIRKFHLTVRDLPVWSFDKAMKQIFGPDCGIELLWNEYQKFLLTKQSNQ